MASGSKASAQAAASVGQGILMAHYHEAFGRHRRLVGQVLLTSPAEQREKLRPMRYTVADLTGDEAAATAGLAAAPEKASLWDLGTCILTCVLRISYTNQIGYHSSDFYGFQNEIG